MRSDLSDDPPFLELLDRVRRVCLDAHDHQTIPFELVAADLGIPLDPDRPPFCRVRFSHGRRLEPPFRVGDTEFSPIVPVGPASRYDLELRGFQQDGRYFGWFDYDTGLFSRPAIERLAAQFRHVTERVAADPVRTVSELITLTPAPRQAIRSRAGRRSPAPNGPGMIVMLNGISSAGKTTLARSLQDRLAEPYLCVGMDAVYAALARRYATEPNCQAEVVQCRRQGDRIVAISFTPFGDRLVLGMHRMVAGLADAGLNVIVDHGVSERRWWADLEGTWTGLDVLRVGVLCSLAVAEERERARGDRLPGWARAHADLVHAGARYDLTVDTSRDTLAACASAIASAIADRAAATER